MKKYIKKLLPVLFAVIGTAIITFAIVLILKINKKDTPPKVIATGEGTSVQVDVNANAPEANTVASTEDEITEEFLQ